MCCFCCSYLKDSVESRKVCEKNFDGKKRFMEEKSISFLTEKIFRNWKMEFPHTCWCIKFSIKIPVKTIFSIKIEIELSIFFSSLTYLKVFHRISWALHVAEFCLNWFSLMWVKVNWFSDIKEFKGCFLNKNSSIF